MSPRGLEPRAPNLSRPLGGPNRVQIMRQLLLPLLPVLALGLSANALAQNTCSTPLDVGNGLGTHTWLYSLLTPSTDSGFDGNGSCQGEFLSIYEDAFFLWTAPGNGNFRFDNSFMGGDPELAVYRGVDCLAYCAGYDSDSGPGLTSELTLSNVQTGQQFLVQVGTWQNNSSFSLVVGFDVSQVSDPCNQPDDAYEENDDCTEAFPITDGGYFGLDVSKSDKDIYSFCLAPGATVDVDIFFYDTEGDVDLFLFEANDSSCGEGAGGNWLARGFTVTDDESLSYTNTSGATMRLAIEVQLWSGSQFSNCTDYYLFLNGAEACPGAFESFCDPMSQNSTGQSTRINGYFGTGVGSDLHLDSTQGPPNQFGYFLVGSAASSIGTTPLGNGSLCLATGAGNSLGRFNVSGGVWNSFGLFDLNGDLTNIVGTSSTGFGFDVPASLPLPGTPMIQSGQTWHFQLWHREDAGQSNFSNGLSVTF